MVLSHLIHALVLLSLFNFAQVSLSLKEITFLFYLFLSCLFESINGSVGYKIP
jgi:hypothetical protein